MSDPVVVYFSSVTNNTHRFVEKLGFKDTIRIPLKKTDPELIVDRPYCLVTPTYGGGVTMSQASAVDNRPVPPQVRRFLSNPVNIRNLSAVIATGNLNFGADYGRAGEVISAKFGVPYVYRLELMGTEEDVAIVHHGLTEFFNKNNIP